MQDDATGRPERVKVQDLMAELGLGRSAGAAGDMDAAIAGLGALGGVEKAVLHVGVSVGQTLGERMGMRNLTEVTRTLPYPYATVLRAMLVAMTSGKSGLAAAVDTARGAYLEGAVPGSLWSYAGTLGFDVIDSGTDRTEVAGSCTIPGQKIAWGKGKASLDAVFDRAEALARRL